MTAPAVPLTYAGEVYDRTSSLFTGDVPVRGVALRYVHTDIEDLFGRQGRNGEFDAAEYSMGAHIASLQRQDWGFVGLPIFPSKQFRHSAICVHPQSGIRSPKDLEGRCIGTPEWSMTASLWLRGILGEHYGVDLRSIRWRIGGLDQPGRPEKSRMAMPAGFDIAPLARGNTLGEAFIEREVDAIVSARLPKSLMGRPDVCRPLFDDFAGEEAAYFQATRVFPVMHLVIVRKALVQQHPWLPNNLVNAFGQAQQAAQVKLMNTGYSVGSLAWEAAYARREQALMGNAFAHGVEPNRPALEALCRYAHDQGFSPRPLQLADLFEPSTLSAVKS